MTTAVSDDLRQKSKAAARAERLKARERFRAAYRAERAFGRQLRGIARQIGNLVNKLAPQGIVTDWPRLNQALQNYARMIQPWAKSVAARMVAEVGRRDENSWAELSSSMGRALKKELRNAPTGLAMRSRLQEAEELITSLPIEAAQRVHQLTTRAMLTGTRARETAREIARTGKVTESRAMLIARTETTRTAGALMQARAQAVGSKGYIWRTSRDSDVRELHRELEGTYHLWTEPPIAGERGERAHPGGIYNCRCFAEPVLPDIT